MNINRKNYESWFLDYHEGTLAPDMVLELFVFLKKNPDLLNELEAFEVVSLPSDITTVSFENKDFLRRKEINDDQVREWMVDILEGEKNNRQELLSSIAHRPDLLQQWNDLQNTILEKEGVSFSAKNLLKKNPAYPVNAQQLLIGSIEGNLTLQEQIKLNKLLEAYPILQVEKELFFKTRLTPEPIEYPAKEKLRKRSARLIAFNIKRNYLRIAASLILLLGAWFILSREAEQPTGIAINNPVPTIKVNPSKIEESIPSTVEESPAIPEVISPVVEQSRAYHSSGTNFRTSNTAKQNLQIPNPEEISLPASQQMLAIIEPMPLKEVVLQLEEPFVNVQRRPYLPTSEVIDNSQLGFQPDQLVKKAVSTASETVNKVTANTPLAPEANGTRLTLSSRAIRSLAWVVGKASDDRIKIKTTFNPLTGTLAAYEVETANRKWQKQF
jgi:hypothetical protein